MAPLDQDVAPLAGGGSLFFLDKSHGWLDLALPSSAAIHSSLILVTNDGGKTWRWPTGRPSGHSSGTMVFSSPQDGWILSPDHHELYVTHDGAKHWEDVTLSVPTEALPATGVILYGLPHFGDQTHGYMLTYVAKPGLYAAEAPTDVLFRTTDAGQTWKVDRTLPLSREIRGDAMPHSIVDSDLMLVSAADGKLHRTAVHEGGVKDERDANPPPSTQAFLNSAQQLVWKTSFVDRQTGWVLVTSANCLPEMTTCAELLSTQDGGGSWKNITPRAFRSAANTSQPGAASAAAASGTPYSRPYAGAVVRTRQMTQGQSGDPNLQLALGRPPARQQPSNPAITAQSSAIAASAVQPLAAPGANISQHVGFDNTFVYNATTMSDLWTVTPYFDLGLYLPGAANKATDQTLKSLGSTWVSTIQTQGWGLIPLWVGPQPDASCILGRTFKSTINLNTTTAQAQGSTEALSAIAAAIALGLGGTNQPIYVDIENYNSTACGASIRAFLAGWISQIHTGDGTHSYTWRAGVYGNPGPATSDFSQLSPLPDDVFIAKAPSNAPVNLTTWGLSPLCDPFIGTPSCDTWAHDQRIHQLTQDRAEIWGAASINLDNDIEDAEIVPGNGYKTLTYNGILQYDVPGATATLVYGISNFDPNLASGFSGVSGRETIMGAYQTGTGASACTYTFTATGNATVGFGAPTSLPQYPGTVGFCYTQGTGINDYGQIVGATDNPDGRVHGFLYVPGSGYHLIDYPGSTNGSNATAINDAGVVVGNWQDITHFAVHGYIAVPPYGPTNFYSIDVPGAATTTVGYGTSTFGISGNGEVSGSYTDTSGVAHGYVAFFDPNLGSLSYSTNVDITGVTDNYEYGINNNGTFVSRQETFTSPTTYNLLLQIYQASKNSFASLTYPAASANTYAAATNDAFHVVGYYQDTSNAYHGLVWAPAITAPAFPIATLNIGVALTSSTPTGGGAGTLVYTANVTDSGPSSTSAPVLTITVQGNATLIAGSSSASCSQNGSVITCAVGTLNAGGSTPITVAISVPTLSNPPQITFDATSELGTGSANAGVVVVNQPAADVPIPVWALALLGTALGGSVFRKSRRQPPS